MFISLRPRLDHYLLQNIRNKLHLMLPAYEQLILVPGRL
jgi:hypothetical protein